MTSSGRTVILYSGGRSEASAHAAASHTASVAGNYPITRELAMHAGVVVAENFDDFDDLVMLFDFLRGKPLCGLRLGALTNAEYPPSIHHTSLVPSSITICEYKG